MTGKDLHCEPEGSRLEAKLELNYTESPRPRLVADFTLATPVGEDNPLTALVADPLALVREAVRQYKDANNSRRDHERNRIEAEKRLFREPGATGSSRTPRPPKRGRGRLFCLPVRPTPY